MTAFMLWLVFGALVGWLAGIVMQTGARRRAPLNVAAGIAGALLGSLLFNQLGLGLRNVDDSNFGLGALLLAFAGAVVLLGLASLARRERSR